MKKPWNIKQLYAAYLNDLSLCQTNLERETCTTLCRKEIFDKAKEFRKTRKLTPGEQSILDNF